MSEGTYLDDPTKIYSALKPAWKKFRTNVTKLALDAISKVEVWKESEDMILPIHPFSQFIDTTRSDGIWRDRSTLFVPEVKNPHRRVRHGFSKSGQVVVAQREHFSMLVLQGKGYFDIAGASHEKNGKYSEMPTRPRYVRYMLDQEQRITQILDYSPTEDENVNVELLNWQKNQLTESYLQTFDSGKELPGWAEDLPLEEQASLYRQATKAYREYMPRRGICRFAYAKDGALTSVKKNRLERPKDVTVIYSRSVGDTVGKVLEELAGTLSEQVLAMLKKSKKHHPLRAVALLFSAEHAHTGLPWGIAAIPADSEIQDATDVESYSIQLDWPTAKPALQKLVNRFIIAVEASPEYRDSDAPKAYRDLLWQVSLHVAKELHQSKIADKRFTILPIDDHGDIDPKRDFKDCVSKRDAKYFPLLAD